MIGTTALTKCYGSFTAVDSLDLNIPQGEIYGFLGPNGAGKTSTIMMLLGATRPSSGEIRLFGEPYTPDRLELRKRIGVVPEKHPRGVWRWMTARDYLGFFADLFEVRNAKNRIGYLLEKVELAQHASKKIHDFSHGMLQKLSIIRSLLHDPDILFLDEPISGLDPIGIKQIRDLIISENREGRTIFISSHQLSEMEKICHRVAIISHGKLIVEDSMQNLLGRVAVDREVHIELESIPEGLTANLEELRFVREVLTQGNTLVVKVAKEGDHRKALSQRLIKLDLVPLHIAEKTPTLEEAFVTITQANIERLVGGGSK
jgi:ABC-2 type transport system ATP-binding protein